MSIPQVRTALVLTGVLTLAVAGCGGGDDGSDTGGSSKTSTSPVSGEARVVSKAKSLTPLIVTAREPAIPFKASNGKWIVTYELGMRNATPLVLTPTKVQISAPGGEVIKTLDQPEIAADLALPSARSGVKTLSEAQAATFFVTLEFDSESDVPDALEQTVTVTGEGLPDDGVESAPPTTVEVNKDVDVPVLGPPLESGKSYVASDSCCASERHRRALLSIDGHEWLAQRFAVDWEQLDSTNRTVKEGGDPSKPADYTIYGKKAIAAADGTVVHILDGLPDAKPGELPEGLSIPEADGNSVIASLGNGLYMLYAHFKAGSIKVKVGDKIKRGDLLGLVGNSGNSSAPHLHFHVMDGRSGLSSEGVPYVIDSFKTTGQIVSNATFFKYENTSRPFKPVPSPSDGDNKNEMPLDPTIVDLP